MAKDPAQVKAYKAEYRKANAERIKAYKAEYRKANAERIKAYRAEYYKANAEELKARQAEYRKLQAYLAANAERFESEESMLESVNRETSAEGGQQ